MSVPRVVWAFVGNGKKGHAFRLAENGQVADPRYALCGIGPGAFTPTNWYLEGVDPVCSKCNALAPIVSEVIP